VEYQKVSVPEMKVKGDFNVQNAQAAKSAVMSLFDDVDERKIDTSLSGFKGTWRRFEYKGVTESGAVVYDDYAHHPTAVRGTIEMAKEEFTDKTITVIFHPHLYSRTKEFFSEFAQSLSLADEAFVLPIYAAREKLDSSVSSEKLAEKITTMGGNAKFVADFENAKKLLEKKGDKDLILTMGAGDVYLLGNNIVKE
jgi:UDP-N-acetylmuramate--alanine ligase